MLMLTCRSKRGKGSRSKLFDELTDEVASARSSVCPECRDRHSKDADCLPATIIQAILESTHED